jgi:hypothetical protein
MMLLRFHLSGARFRSFPRRFYTLRGKEQLRFHLASSRCPSVSYFVPIHGKRETKSPFGACHEDKVGVACPDP